MLLSVKAWKAEKSDLLTMLEDVLWLCPSLLTCLLLSAVSVAAIVFLKVRLKDQSTLPPGPRGWEALCSVVKAVREENLDIQAEKWSGQYGELVLCRTALGDMVFLNSARLVREVFAGKNLEALTNNRRTSFIGWYLFNGYCDLVTSDSSLKPEWTKMRKLFHRSVKFYGDGVDRMESLLHTELQRLVTESQDRLEVDVCMTEILSASVLHIIVQLITGEQPQPGMIQMMTRFAGLLIKMSNPVHDVVLATFPWLRFLPLTPFRALCTEVIDVKSKVFTTIISAAKTTRIPGEPRGLADYMLDEQAKGDNSWLSNSHIEGLLLDVLAAGHITSTETLTAAFLYLTHHPEIQQRVQAEIEDNIGDQQPRLVNRNDLAYTEAFILETLRFSSLLPLGIAHETLDDVIMDGYTISKGTMVFANANVFHRDPEMFPDPDCFRPARFLDDEGHLLPANHRTRQSLLPFGVGKRSCPGESFARSRVFLYVTTLLQNFDFLPPSHHPLLPTTRDAWNNGTVLNLKPYHVTLRRRRCPDQQDLK